MDDELALVIGFLNTLDVEAGTDELRDAAGARRWLARQGVAQAVDDGDLQSARALRSVLRRLATAHHDQEPDADASARFTEVARSLPLHAVADPDDTVRLQPAGQGMTAVLGRIVAAVARSSQAGTWARVKVCPADDCRWAFVDESKNRSRRWCAMGVCGNRQKTRAYRQRQRQGAAGG